MRLTRFLIVALFVFFFAFGIRSQVFAQTVPTGCVPQTGTAYNNCVNGGAAAFYGNPACVIITCSASYIPGAFPKLPVKLIEDIKAEAQAKKSGTSTAQSYFGVAISSIFSKGICGSIGCGVDANGNIALGPAVDGVKYSYRDDGAINSVIAYTNTVIHPPASTAEYVAYVKDSIQHPFSEPAYAQGLGFSSLSPVLELWKIFRNVAYFFFVVIFIVIGFLIMFRSKIGGQAAVTIQQALPKIVISLLLVTFSYAIVGLMIDIMYLSIYLMIGIFSSGSTGLNVTSLTEIAFTDSIFANGFGLLGTTTTIAGMLKDIVVAVLKGLGWADFTALGVGLAVDLVALLVLSVALIVSLFRIFFGLLKAYVGIFFSVILAPIQLLLGALPGQNTFGSWIKGIWTNLAVFPVVIFFIFSAHYFAKQASINPTAYTTTSNSIGRSLPLGDVTQSANAEGLTPLQSGITTGVGGSAAAAFLIFGILATLPKAMEISSQLAAGKFEVGDVGKNIGEMWKSGRPGATKAILSPLNVGVGATVGALGARKLTKGTGYQGAAGVLGGIAGGLIGGATALPSTIGIKAAKSLMRESGDIVTQFGLEGVEGWQQRRATAEAAKSNARVNAIAENPTQPSAQPSQRTKANSLKNIIKNLDSKP